MTKQKDYMVPLNFGLGSFVSQEDIDLIYKEACCFPDGSREKKGFMAYAKRLEQKLERQREIDGQSDPTSSAAKFGQSGKNKS